MELEEYSFPGHHKYSRCQALGMFSENVWKRVILSTLNVNISESEVIFLLKFQHCSASAAHYNMT